MPSKPLISLRRIKRENAKGATALTPMNVGIPLALPPD
jgi:hypothetical protein